MIVSKEFVHESLQDNQSVARFLKSLMEGFEKGKITLETGPDQIEFSPNDLIKFNLKAKSKRDKAKLTLRFSWKPAQELTKDNGEIIISSD